MMLASNCARWWTTTCTVLIQSAMWQTRLRLRPVVLRLLWHLRTRHRQSVGACPHMLLWGQGR